MSLEDNTRNAVKTFRRTRISDVTFKATLKD